MRYFMVYLACAFLALFLIVDYAVWTHGQWDILTFSQWMDNAGQAHPVLVIGGWLTMFAVILPLHFWVQRGGK